MFDFSEELCIMKLTIHSILVNVYDRGFVMKNIDIKKFAIIVISTVLTFSLAAGIGLWILARSQTQKAGADSETATGLIQNDKINTNQDKQTNTTNETVQSSNQNTVYSEVEGDVTVTNINTLISTQKYTLMVDGAYDGNRLANFLNLNISKFLPEGSALITYNLADLNKDGISEVAILYEKTRDGSKYLMAAALRWEDSGFVKNIDTVLKKDSYNPDTNEITAGDIITGGNNEFVFLQKDLEGTKGSRIMVAVMLQRGFSEFYTEDSGFELEVQDYDDDGRLEIYKSVIAGDGTKYMTWSKWNGKDFIEYKNQSQPIYSDSEQN